MNKEEIENQITKKATVFQVGGFRPEESPLSSWLGRVLVQKPNEEWPQSNGEPMIPVCQINLKELQYVPKNLKDIQFLTVFINPDSMPDDKPNGSGWELRAYNSIEELEEITNPIDGPIKPFQMKGDVVGNDFPCWEDCPIEIPEEYEEEYYDLFPNKEGIKLGGWPTLVQSEIFWAPFNEHPATPEYVLQIDSVEKANWSWGQAGIVYIGRGTKPDKRDVWTFSWQCM